MSSTYRDRRPGIERVCAAIKRANPTWTNERCLAEAKARLTQPKLKRRRTAR